MNLYLASGNTGKLREFREGGQLFGISVEVVAGFREMPPCIEDRDTFEANARKKAAYYSQASDGLVFADDSGLAVDALGGRPGVHSARYAGEGASDDENNRKLLDELAIVQAFRQNAAIGTSSNQGASGTFANASAHYLCVIALANRGKLLGVFEGRVDGVIQQIPRGHGGFGYDPFFLVPELSRTFAELSPQEKFAVSHRGVAFRKMVDFLIKSGWLEQAKKG
jgi:XTP/dITP diphosphohydrolase